MINKEDIFKGIARAPKSEKTSKILELCRDKMVLDVGCVGQDRNYDSPDWLHSLIKNVCHGIDGVDIDSAGLKVLSEKGFSVFSVEEIKRSGKKYDIVLMSDVIEHVNDPVGFLMFYSEYLSDKGIIIITTPNAHGVRNFTNILLRNNYSVNPEHTYWLCPKTITEIADRAQLQYVDFYWLDEYFKLHDVKGIKFKIIYLINAFFMKLRSNFYPNFMYIVSK